MNFPGNPTGGIMTREDFSEIVPLIQQSGIAVVTDEIYAELTYSGKHCSIASFDEIKDQVILIICAFNVHKGHSLFLPCNDRLAFGLYCRPSGSDCGDE